jgi:CheY-like chemotaxis protein
VITDLIMPDQEGLETIRQLRARDPNIPVIAMSGGGRTHPDTYLKIAANMGANAVLAKPFTFADLTAAIDKAMTD